MSEQEKIQVSVQVIQVNGEPVSIPSGCTISQLLTILEMADRRLAVAHNRGVVPRSRYGTVVLSHGDRVEVLEAVGGG